MIAVVLQIFGTVPAPSAVAAFSSGTHGEGLILFISNLIKVVVIIAGLFATFNIIGAGYTYLGSAGNTKATEDAMHQLTYSLIGLLIIVGAFGLTSIISYLVFGNASFILNPTLPTAQ